MKTIGILGGLGPETTAHFYLDIVSLCKKAGLTEKGERALYKNLEDLEKSRHISYENKILKLTNKGAGNYKKTKSQLSPYLNIIKIIESENLLKLTKKARTTFVSG